MTGLSRRCTIRELGATFEGVLPEQIRLILKASKGASVEEQWYKIWDILFPNSVRPASIYQDNIESEDFSAFREFNQNEGLSFLMEFIREEGLILGHGPFEEELRESLRTGLDSMVTRFCSIHKSGIPGSQDSMAPGYRRRPRDVPPSRRIPRRANLTPSLDASHATTQRESNPDQYEGRASIMGHSNVIIGMDSWSALEVDEFNELYSEYADHGLGYSSANDLGEERKNQDEVR